MSEFPDTTANVSPEMAAMLESFQKKKALNTNSRQNVMNSSTSSLKESTSQVCYITCYE